MKFEFQDSDWFTFVHVHQTWLEESRKGEWIL